MEISQEPIQIDLDKVLAAKLGGKARWVPRPLVSWLKRTIHQDELNAILLRHAGERDSEFCRAIVRDFGLGLHVRGEVPGPEAQRAIFACNHPLGGLDGISLIAVLSANFGDSLRFVVNDLLMAVEPLAGLFVPVNKHGGQSREAAVRLDTVMAGDGPVAVFPAGLVSRLGDDGRIRDLAWNKMFVTKAISSRRDIIPVHFSGHNSPGFYRLARWRKRLHVPFNIEMLYLPDELLRARGSEFTITFGAPIPWDTLRSAPPAKKAAEIREMVYSLPDAPNEHLYVNIPRA